MRWMAAGSALLVMASTVGCSGSNPSHAEMVALDAATGRVLWSSPVVTNVSYLGRITVNDSIHTVTMSGIDCGSDPVTDVAIVLEQRSGVLVSRGPRRTPRGGGPGAQDAQTGDPILARLGDLSFEAAYGQEPKVSARTHVPSSKDGSLRARQPPSWTRRLPNPHHLFAKADSFSGAVHGRVLYVAVAAQTPGGCIGSD